LVLHKEHKSEETKAESGGLHGTSPTAED